jgi:hypothetical protein
MWRGKAYFANNFYVIIETIPFNLHTVDLFRFSIYTGLDVGVSNSWPGLKSKICLKIVIQPFRRPGDLVK